jgi:hypothetical protein
MIWVKINNENIWIRSFIILKESCYLDSYIFWKLLGQPKIQGNIFSEKKNTRQYGHWHKNLDK